MAIEFTDGKYVDENGKVTLDPTVYKDWQIAEEAEKALPSVDYFREKLGLLPDEIIPYGKTPKLDFIKIMNRLKDKPDAVARNLQGEILAMIQKSGLRIVAMKMIRLTRAQAEAFYEVHKERPFYGELVEYMISGPVVCSVLEGEDAIASYRALMGATNPANAAEGTIRRLYAQSVQANAVHGSDAPETAAREVAFFFSRTEIVG